MRRIHGGEGLDTPVRTSIRPDIPGNPLASEAMSAESFCSIRGLLVLIQISRFDVSICGTANESEELYLFVKSQSDHRF